ncbi:NADH dehydrogenase subunit 6 (mitochondrion) [Macrosteles quadrilineatus]|uniref:NADH-ubiquinone oxidoreductase chain 6 n=1 Tax=Macrosteles quadrilineatus TaxID=74068 RepID=A0A343CXB1_MACQU|nr:NADH dehydrogenase subunit 6 [Macrosteles quadrilineatus]ARQ26993.1 NADH dehydrogenase subunit 6 [Macrosteles quadrilineatus]
MKLTIMKIMLMIPSMTLFMKTPMSMGVMLLMQTIMATMLTSKIMLSSWISMVMFLMLVGGLLILFMYMSSIASNEKFKMNYKMFMLFIIMFVPTEELMSEIQINENEIYMSKNEMLTFMKMYNKKTMMITIMVFIYMLLTMIIVTKIVKINKGPLRAK